MIRLLTEEQRGDFCSFAEGSVFALRVRVNLESYGLHCPFAFFWMQRTGGEVTGIFSRVDGNMTFALSPSADWEETAAFLHAVGFSSLFCPLRCHPLLRETPPDRVLMSYAGESPALHPLPWERTPEPKEIWEVLRHSPELEEVGEGDAFAQWYADVSHKMRRHLARTLLLPGRAVAMTSAESSRQALVSGVAVKREYRGKGLGKAVVQTLVDDLLKEEKEVFLFCKGELVSFYEELGFTQSDEENEE